MENDVVNEVTEMPLQITASAKTYLKETSGWAQFLSIMGFIFIGIVVVAAIGIGIFYSTLGDENMMGIPGVGLGLIYLLVGILYFFPIYYLFRFSTNMKKAVQKNDNDNLDIAFKNIKSHYKFMGIFTIVFISIYVLAAIAMAIFGSSMFL